MKIFKAMVAALWCAVLFVSCDTRDDLYYDSVRSAKYIVEVNGKRDTIPGYFTNYNNILNYDVHVKSQWIFDNYNGGKLYFDTLNVKAYTLVDGVAYPLNIELLVTQHDYDYLLNKLAYSRQTNIMHSSYGEDGNSVDVNFDLVTSYASCFDQDTSSCRLGTLVAGFPHYGLYGETFPGQLEGTKDPAFPNFKLLLQFTLWGPCPPTAVLEVKDVDGNPYEKKLSMVGSFDKDGKVKKYEYCIDGNILPYGSNENRFDYIEGNWQAGQSAYGGDYITSTERSEISYEFQTEGEHKVYYRCMDDMCVWSTWKCETITVKE